MKTFAVAGMCLLLLTGCGLDGPIPSGPKRDASAASKASEPNGATEQSAADKKRPEQRSENRAVDQSSAEKPSAAQRAGTPRQKAAAGMNEKGHGYGDDMITMPVSIMWAAKDKIVRDQIRKALDLYKASEGHAPASHEEFMDRIIKENNLQLPTLPAGHRYVYDPDTDELKIQ
jgi:hypothetical protein